METAIKRAIKGGWSAKEGKPTPWVEIKTGLGGFYWKFKENATDGEYYSRFSQEMWCDPTWWQALGKAEGWEEHRQFESRMTRCICSKCGDTRVTIQWTEWMYHWHSFIDHLSEGKPIDDFFNNLLTNK